MLWDLNSTKDKEKWNSKESGEFWGGQETSQRELSKHSSLGAERHLTEDLRPAAKNMETGKDGKGADTKYNK